MTIKLQFWNELHSTGGKAKKCDHHHTLRMIFISIMAMNIININLFISQSPRHQTIILNIPSILSMRKK
ncbi:hypothetical protein DERF_001909 [Dermatophagoides farinae]|uniref:Uncharacterized protein n=1 Tax=Dermatophagoides farinae TaxID=6954 RepID=A0A922LBJ6_DERFA|nr:hypothetical protein DERF_001909 [Dermatophagoides farinae]